MKKLPKIVTAISLMFMIVCIMLKIIYYFGKYKSAYFSKSSVTFTIVYCLISIMISSLPMVVTFLVNLYLLNRDKMSNGITAYGLIYPMIIFNLIIEFFSMLIGGLSFDNTWTTMTYCMIVFHLTSLIPIILTTINIINFNKR